jgi:hypothetical protein
MTTLRKRQKSQNVPTIAVTLIVYAAKMVARKVTRRIEMKTENVLGEYSSDLEGEMELRMRLGCWE